MAASTEISIGARRLLGDLVVPEQAIGLVIFAHGSGSSRKSRRNVFVAEQLLAWGFATLLFDLLTPAENADRRTVFDIALLADRVTDAVAWAGTSMALPIGLFGASTGAAAAIAAAAMAPDKVNAIVSRGGRPDLAGEALDRSRAPTLLIVGSLDRDVITLNEAARRRMRCEARIAIVPGAGHLFEEPGTLDQVISLAGDWFNMHLDGDRYDHRAVS